MDRPLLGMIRESNDTLPGQNLPFDMTDVPKLLRDLDKWLRRRLLCCQSMLWGRTGYRQLRKRGAGRELAWNPAELARAPWRISHSSALYQALPIPYFRNSWACRSWQHVEL